MYRFLLLILLVPVAGSADDRFYPTIGPDGKVLILKSTVEKSVQSGSTAKPDAAAAPRPDSPPPATGSDRVDGESYLTSERLEKEGFKPEGKNRFYYFPDGSHGYSPIESSEGLPIQKVAAVETGGSVPESVRPSPNYESVGRSTVLIMNPSLSVCLKQKLLKSARSISVLNRLSIEPPVELNDTSPDALLSVASLKESAIRIRSFATSASTPGFYVPFAVWFDQSGCVISGAWNYWLEEIPGSEFRFQALEAVLVQPRAASFLGFYYPNPTQKAPFRLQRYGSMTLEVFE